MTLLDRWFATAGPVAARCGGCRHFEDDPRALEAALPGLAALSSAQASVRGDDGLCAVHDRFTSARNVCSAFAGRD